MFAGFRRCRVARNDRLSSTRRGRRIVRSIHLAILAAAATAAPLAAQSPGTAPPTMALDVTPTRSEEHTSELQSLMRISYAVFCLKQKKKHHSTHEYAIKN